MILLKSLNRLLTQMIPTARKQKMSELPRNPLYGEWVVTTTHWQDRTFLPPPDFCPLCLTGHSGFSGNTRKQLQHSGS